jgi:hypothetical protein
MMSVSDGDDVLMTSSTQNKSKKVNYSTLVKGNPPEGKTTAVVAVMRVIRSMVTTATAVTSTTKSK